MLNIYLLHIPDIKAEVMKLLERNARVKTGFSEAPCAETLAAGFIWIFFFTQHGELI